MRLVLALILCVQCSNAHAVGDEDDYAPPRPSETTRDCADGTVWDAERESCVDPDETTNDRKTMMRDVRELAYAGRYQDAAALLDRLPHNDPFVLTYRGFIARKHGDQISANKYYTAAITADPDNLLARSYMGQGFVEAGRLDAALIQLSEILKRGGRETWPAFSLRSALKSGKGFNY
ncbi:hypothetical protein JM93_04101 [Roseibium hamelinense]|uniref:Uncharacterized protein n=1 Tax=Roseibium hamelinense TaxID=150831 RepID=A0A562SF66_9HYPH|nr:hypothetical protein [Roseibium hamelinense]MTI44226.1 hypothetical protein [Roseibium hamelinense]TWI79989.1 hypothetical protein JM93_04101 [Roseibium hamelinense]